MKSEGPYFHRLMVNGMCGSPCEACSYAEGRKSMEKDFQEALYFANEAFPYRAELCEEYGFQDEVVKKFIDWKKARGIE